MKGSTLVPLFRSEAQAKILAWLLLRPGREQPISTLSAVAGIAPPNVLNEVNRLVQAGILNERPAGRSRMISAAQTSPYFEPLVAILARTYGPLSILPEALEPVPGLDEAIIFGSWAQRYTGTPGPPPRDLDVLLVGTPDRRGIRTLNRTLEEQLDIPVQLIVASRDDWDHQTSGFVRTVASRPHITIFRREATT